MVKMMSKVLNIGNILFLLCISVLTGMRLISTQLYFLLLFAAYICLILTHDHARNEVASKILLRSGCFSSGNEHYGVIHTKTIAEDIARILPEDFPYLIRDLYIIKGYIARVISQEDNNFGTDVIAQQDNEVIVIKAEHLAKADATVGNASIQQIVAAMKLYDATQAIVITNGVFTASALQQALPNGVKLIDGIRLQTLIRESIFLQQRQCHKKVKGLWGILSFCSCFGAGNKAYGILKEATLKRDIERISPKGFEELVSDLFEEMGYRSNTTPDHDLGADVIAKKGKEVIAIQVEHRAVSEEAVDEGAVQQAVAAKAIYRANLSMVVTNGRLTEKAIKLANANDTQFIEGDQLREMIIKYLIEDEESLHYEMDKL